MDRIRSQPRPSAAVASNREQTRWRVGISSLERGVLTTRSPMKGHTHELAAGEGDIGIACNAEPFVLDHSIRHPAWRLRGVIRRQVAP